MAHQNRIHLLNTWLDNLTMDEAVDTVIQLARQDSNAYVVTPNLDHLLCLEEDSEFAAAYRNADLILADGISLVLIAKYLHLPLKEKVSGSDLFPRVCAAAAKEHLSLFILGAAPGVAENAAKNLSNKNPGLKIAGTYSPPLAFEKDAQEIDRIINCVTKAKPDIMAIAISNTKGEKFIHQYRSQLCVPVTLSIGASVDFEAGNKKRAPRWMINIGLEWLYRAIQEPNRIGKRVLRDIKGAVPLIRKYKNYENFN